MEFAQPASTTLAFIDQAIILGFMILVTAVGYYMSKVASQGIEEYFLGKNKIPWWVLGISTATSNFDMTGTMIIVAMVYDFGYRGYLIELRGGVGLSLAFLMIFLGKWLRRSRVMTSAQWMKIRFGTDRSGKAAHIFSAVAQSALSLGMIIYFCVGAGKFLEYFLPWNKEICTMIMVSIGLFYTLLSGLYGVVFTDVIQMIILSFTAIYLAVKGFSVNLYQMAVSGNLPSGWLGLDMSIPESLSKHITTNLTQLKTGAETALKATQDPGAQNVIRSFIGGVNNKLHEYEPLMLMFGVFVFFYVFKAALEGCSGVGGYTDQRFFAARNEREAGFLTLESIIISILRWAMVAGLVALGLWLVVENKPEYAQAIGEITKDSEKILPVVIGALLPAGVKGFVIAGLIAAAMSTFDSTLNAGASYLVVDIYKSYINPKAEMKMLVRASHIATIGLAVVGCLLAFTIQNISSIWGFITMALSAGMFMPLFLRWYWPRFNGWGFSWGTASGMVSAMVFNVVLSSTPLYVSFPTILFCSFLGSVIATYATKPVSEEVLIDFYMMINPFGFWGKYAQLAEDKKLITKEGRFKRVIEKLNDFISTCLAVPFQFTILLATMALVFRDWYKFVGFSLIAMVCSVGLYFFWFRNLKTHEQCDEEDEYYAEKVAVKTA